MRIPGQLGLLREFRTEELEVDVLTKRMEDPFVSFLDASCGFARVDVQKQIRVGFFDNATAATTDQGNRVHTFGASCVEAANDILRVSGGRDPDRNIVILTKSLDGFFEDLIETRVVPNACQKGCVGRQGHAGQWTAVSLVAIDPFPSKVKGITGTAAIAENENLFVCLNSGPQHFSHLEKGFLVALPELSFGAQTLVQGVT